MTTHPILGQVAPIDLEALRAVLAVLEYETRTIPIDSRDYGPQRKADVTEDIAEARRTVRLVLAELTTRRARDAEVEALVEMAQLVHDECDAHNDFAIDAKRRLRIAIAPFTGAKP